MLGLVLLYVGIVLIQNGLCRIYKVDAKSTAVMNIFVGAISIICNLFLIGHAEFIQKEEVFYSAATGLLFGLTYLFSALNGIYKLDLRPYGWYSLFVAINAIPAAYFSYEYDSKGFEGIIFPIIWIMWGILWFTGFVECALGKKLNFVPYLAIFEGIFTAWIPAWLFFGNVWM